MLFRSYICSGAAANITINAAGGFAPLSYVWADSLGTTSTIVANPPSPTEYYVTTADACGQSRIDSVRVSISNLSSTITNVDSVTCFGYTDGTATVTGATGLVPYHYIWSSTNDTTAMTTGLGAGTYTVTVSDLIGCTSTSTVTLVNPPQLAITLAPSDEYCLNSCNGSIANTLIGPYQLPVSYLWSTSPAQTTQNASNLCAGNYTVTVTYSSHNCSVTQSATVSTLPITATLAVAPTDQLCLGACNGQVAATIGGTYDLPVTYQWSTTPVQTTQTATNLCAGTYTVTASYSQYHCPLIQTATVGTTPPQATLTLTPANEFCFMSCNGQVAATLSGTYDPPVTYHWSTFPSQSTATATNLCPGDYTVTVTYSQYHCPLIQSANVSTNVIIDAFFSSNPSPPEGYVPFVISFNSTGTISATTYLWDFGDGNTSTAVNPTHTYAEMGIYTVTLTVNSGPPNNCSDTYQMVVHAIQPSSMHIPNVFTPNGDGKNDWFSIESEGIVTINIDVYNRWGKKVYNYNGESFSDKKVTKEVWDGTSKSEGKCADGTYFYILDATGDDKKEYHLQGTITLMR